MYKKAIIIIYNFLAIMFVPSSGIFVAYSIIQLEY